MAISCLSGIGDMGDGRDRIASPLDRLNRFYTELAPLLGLSLSGLHKQMRGVTAVSRQTELLLEQLELRRQTELVLEQLKKGSSGPADTGTAEDGRHE